MARLAFEWAKRNARRKVTIVHKTSVLQLTDGLFLEAARAVAADYPQIECDDFPIDAITMPLLIALRSASFNGPMKLVTVEELVNVTQSIDPA